MDKRILIIEDNPGVVEAHVFYLNQLRPAFDVSIESTDSKYEAMERLRRKIYDVAVIDLMLKEDVTSQGGLDIVEFIQGLHEGTRAIVVTQDHEALAARFALQHGAVDYLIKDVHGGYVLLDKVRSMLEDNQEIQKNRFGVFGTLSGYLAAPEKAPYWADQMHRAIGVNFTPFDEAVCSTLVPLAPLLRPWSMSDGSFAIVNETRSIHGTFWSKALGQPVWVSFAGPGGELAGPAEEFTGRILADETVGPVACRVWQLVDTQRDAFVDTVFDIREG
jgi:CheY-like chemotaxis protein